MRPCFMFSNVGATDRSPALITISDAIGLHGMQAKDFAEQLHAVKSAGQTELSVEISSPGGSVSDALAMYNSLRYSGLAITTKVMGAAMSAASLVFMAGDKRVMPRNTWLMLHNPSTIAVGNAEQLREAAEVLHMIGGLVRGTYCARSGVSDAKMHELLAQDTFLSADEAKEMGFATELAAPVTATARFDMVKAQLPARVRAAYAAHTAPAMSEGIALWKAFRAARV